MWTIDVYEYMGEPFKFAKVGEGTFRIPSTSEDASWGALFRH